MTVRRELRFLRLYALGNSLVMIVLVTAAFRQTASPQKFDRISVQRLDVVDANGTLRMVISNKDHMHPGIMDGKTIDRPRPVAGMIFFNDEGDEVGGLTYTGREANGTRHADAGLMFDQLKQDQTIGLSYTENNRRRSAGLQVWDRSDSHLSDLIEKINAANKIEDHMAREAEMAKIRASAPPAPLVDREAQHEQRDHLEQRDERIDGESRERRRMREADRAGVQACLRQAVQFDMFAQDEAERGTEHDDRAGDIAEHGLVVNPERNRQEDTDDRRHRQFDGNPEPVQPVERRSRHHPYLMTPRTRSQFASSVDHAERAGSSLASPTPCGPFSKMCISAGTPAFRSAR